MRQIPWSELPSELLALISDRLGTIPDTHTFRLVCKVWHESTSLYTRGKLLNILSPLLPYTFSINNTNFKEKLQTKFSIKLVPCLVFIVRSLVNNELPPWLCAVKEITPGKFRVCLPHSLPEGFNVSFFCVLEMGRFYRFNNDKVILISNPKLGTSVEIVDYKAIVLDKSQTLQIILIKHGILDRLPLPGNEMCDDVVNFQGSVFAIDRKGRLYRMGYNDTGFKMVVSKPVGVGFGSDMKKRLVVDTTNGELYLVHRTPSYMKMILVYKPNFEYEKWDEVSGIGVDRILVVICNSCFFTTTKDIPGLGGNCMIFERDDFPAYYNFSTTENVAIPYTGLFSFPDGSCKTWDGRFFSPLRPQPPWVLKDNDLLNSLSIPERVTVRGFCNHVFSESSCTTETCVSEAVLHLKEELKAKPAIRRLQRLAREHLHRMLNERKREKHRRRRSRCMQYALYEFRSLLSSSSSSSLL